MIRAANESDVDALVTLGRLLHSSSSYRLLPYSDTKVRNMMLALIAGAGVVFVADKDGEVVGGLAGSTYEHWFGPAVYGVDWSFFVHPEHRSGITAIRLMDAFETWCKKKGATEVRLGITTDIRVASTTRFYEHCGYRRNGLMFTKEIGDGNR